MSGGPKVRWIPGCAVLLCCSCGFSVEGAPATPDDGDLPDVPDDMPPDVAPPELRTLTAIVTRGSANILATLPFDSDTGFLAPCAEAPGDVSRDLLAHPSLPYVYSARNAFDGYALACSNATKTSTDALGAPRPIQRIVFDPPTNTGFFTIDGPGSVGVFRFVVDAAGVPTVGTSSDGPSLGGAMDLEAAGSQLVVSGNTTVWSWALSSGLEFPGPSGRSNAAGCAAAVGLKISGNSVYQFCADSPVVRRYTRSPFAAAPDAGTIGNLDGARPLTATRMIVARVLPPSLAIVDLGEQIAVTEGPVLAGRVSALNTSSDGRYVAIARAINATESQIDVYNVNDTSLTLIDSHTITGAVGSLAIAPPISM